MIKKLKGLLITLFVTFIGHGQGLNHQWLIGYDTALFDTNVTSTKARLFFTNQSVNIIPESRNLAFRAAQANISDENGNLLMATNGCWIMNAVGDTMMNGSGLNPDPYTSQWCYSQSGIPYHHANLFLPYPDDTTKYILFHHTGNASYYNSPTDLYFSIINKTLDNGLGGITQKNQIAIQDSLALGITACKHANGRDWWIVMLKDSSDLIYKILLTPQGITSITTQPLGVNHENTLQPIFSPNGRKYAYRTYNGTWGNFINEIRLFDFDRCTGNFSNLTLIQWQHNLPGLGVSFSPNSKYIYTNTFDRIYQINTDTANIPASLQLIAINDGYCFPYSITCTDFWVMYLAANGKIYISSGNSVVDMHYINHPDSSGSACDVQQHALHLPNYYIRGHVNHPNYYLGCDTTCTPCLVSVNEISHDFKFNIYPNPSLGNFKIIYLLPHASTGSASAEGKLEIYDVTGKIVYEMRLPQWSTLQQISLPNYISNGLYNCVISSDGQTVSRKIAIIKE